MNVLVDQLQDAGYPAQTVHLDKDTIDLDFIGLTSRLSKEISLLLQTEEAVNSIDTMDNLDHWKMEISSFLKELRCPYVALYEGDIQQRLSSKNHRLMLVDFLLSELLSARMLKFRSSETGGVQSSTVNQLADTLSTLNLSPPPPTVTCVQFFKQILSLIDRLPSPAKDQLIGKPLFCGGTLTEDQWSVLNQVAMDLEREYAVRRTMLVTRLSATLQSFSWSEKIKSKIPDHISNAIAMEQFKNSAFTNISVADILAARTDLAMINKISSSVAGAHANKLKKVKVGRVPDRGGRPSEQGPPPPEMPPWEKRSGQPHTGHGGGGHRGGYRGRGGMDRGGYGRDGGYSNRSEYDDRRGHSEGGGFRSDNRDQDGRRGHHGGQGRGDHRHRGVQDGRWKQKSHY